MRTHLSEGRQIFNSDLLLLPQSHINRNISGLRSTSSSPYELPLQVSPTLSLCVSTWNGDSHFFHTGFKVKVLLWDIGLVLHTIFGTYHYKYSPRRPRSTRHEVSQDQMVNNRITRSPFNVKRIRSQRSKCHDKRLFFF